MIILEVSHTLASLLLFSSVYTQRNMPLYSQHNTSNEMPAENGDELNEPRDHCQLIESNKFVLKFPEKYLFYNIKNNDFILSFCHSD